MMSRRAKSVVAVYLSGITGFILVAFGRVMGFLPGVLASHLASLAAFQYPRSQAICDPPIPIVASPLLAVLAFFWSLGRK
ncbi:hypothetical protein BO70DRAFT_357745 [Aspergillus heteromorphus CBS 117.55]|uniref:Uncharacterized protein n=1 Tax=Aspergillus heteromorphus CBS 117.55 TaxID=1448321 RepID=A0A317X4Z5_9EURO|nr:uncharacterized protein BO70DRAFT_357745 [Aspergillus heteromorphus CBS 117.55]PWY92607.1 hypothetical protein BO70DRAFT_357745 [Aspergillus heteromorphus CBS 117.55]